MQEFDVVARIQELCQARSWTYYRLAKASGIPYSTLSTMLHKTNVPSVPSLLKICNGFKITLAQFFSTQDATVELTNPNNDVSGVVLGDTVPTTDTGVDVENPATGMISGLSIIIVLIILGSIIYIKKKNKIFKI